MKKTGKVVLMGRTGDFKPFLLHVYKLQGQKLVHDKLGAPCKHTSRICLLSVVISEKEYLAFSCSECRDIKLLDLETMEVIKAYGGERRLMRMCEGEGNTIYVEASHGQILKLNCTDTVLSVTNIIDKGEDVAIRSMCYVPSPYRLLVVSDYFRDVQVISVDTNAEQWARLDELRTTDSDPYGLFYSSEHRILLLADGKFSGILVLNPGTGDTLQTINLPGKGDIRALGFSDDHLVLRNNTCLKRKISFFKVN